jgi:DNA mismatch repair protein MLH1
MSAQQCYVDADDSLLQVIFPAMRMFLKPGRHRATDGSVVELTRLEKLYKIFERC